LTEGPDVELQIDIVIEPTLFEWEADKRFSEVSETETANRIREFNRWNGEYPNGEDKAWEDDVLLKNRLMEVMERHLDRSKVVIVCHGMLMRSIDKERWPEYGEIREFIHNFQPQERFSTYDMTGNKTGRTLVLGDKHVEGECSIFVHIVIANHEGKFLLQKRSQKKRFFPGVWDTTGGCVKHSEKTIEAALRETKEETGSVFDENQVRMVRRVFSDNIVDVYFARKDFTLSDCNMDKDEVDELKLFSADEMLKLFDERPNRPDDEYFCVLRFIIDQLL
jgi:8-oxo-dGTP diphosphatase